MKKYELTSDYVKILNGIKLYRIRALKDFGHVAKGDFGGFIEKEENLSQEGKAWVADNAYVYGNAQVYGNARVFDSVRISGNAEVSGNAKLSGNALVMGNAKIYGDARIYNRAQVFDDAEVFGYAEVFENARVFATADVFGYALVHGKAQVHGNARVYGCIEIYGNAQIAGSVRMASYAHVAGDAFITEKTHFFCACGVGSENGRLTVFTGKNELLVTRGCFTGTVDEFLKESKEIHDEITHREYQLLIEVAKSRIKNPFYLRKPS